MFTKRPFFLLLVIVLFLVPGGIACGSDSGSSEEVGPANGAAEAPASSADEAVAFENPGGTPVPLAPTDLSPAATDAGFVEWTAPPAFGDGWSLTGGGIVAEGAELRDPMAERAPAFAVYYKGHEEPMVVLLPDLPMGEMWDTNETIAPTSYEIEGRNFTFEAYSPLFGDSGNVELHVFGRDPAGNETTLSVIDIR